MTRSFAWSKRGVALCALPLFALPVLIAGCGSESSPKDVTVEKLKPAMSLQAIPGENSVTLVWTANNNEGDFSGFNIYMSTSGFDAVKTAFNLAQVDANDPHVWSPITFRDPETDDEIESVRKNLSVHFNYDMSAKGSKDPGDGKSFNPLIRCNVKVKDQGGECVKVTDANDEMAANGRVFYTIKDLDPTKTYTFFVSSTLDEGQKAVSPATNVVTVSPHKTLTVSDASFSFDGPGGNNEKFGVDLSAAMTSGTFAPMTFTATNQNGEGFCVPGTSNENEKKAHFFFDRVNGVPGIAGANGTRIAELGPVTDTKGTPVTSSLLESIERLDGTALVPRPDSAFNSGAPETNDVGAKAGYSSCGRTLVLFPNHLYSIAFKDPDSSDWRYAILETGGNVDNPQGIKVVIGNKGARRL